MKITKIEDSDNITFMELLLLADEELKMIEKYLYRGEMFALYDDNLKSVCVVTQESDDVCELKNIATSEKWQGKGYGSKLLNHIFSHYKGKYTTMLVGTGDISWIIEFYQKNGFRLSHKKSRVCKPGQNAMVTSSYDQAAKPQNSGNAKLLQS